ncbi:hypothetical protein RUND412_011010 [Rhizina undulata]
MEMPREPAFDYDHTAAGDPEAMDLTPDVGIGLCAPALTRPDAIFYSPTLEGTIESLWPSSLFGGIFEKLPTDYRYHLLGDEFSKNLKEILKTMEEEAEALREAVQKAKGSLSAPVSRPQSDLLEEVRLKYKSLGSKVDAITKLGKATQAIFESVPGYVAYSDLDIWCSKSNVRNEINMPVVKDPYCLRQRYVFRVYSKNSQGENGAHGFKAGFLCDDNCIASTGQWCGLEWPKNKLKECIERHLFFPRIRTRSKFDSSQPSPFISVTKSLLEVFSRAEKHPHCRDPITVRIAMIDTEKIHSSTIHSVTKLINNYALTEAKPEHHRNEFLVLREIPAEAVVVTAWYQELKDCGLRHANSLGKDVELDVKVDRNRSYLIDASDVVRYFGIGKQCSAETQEFLRHIAPLFC